MIDRTEQERLCLYFIVLKYCKTKGSIRRMMLLKQHGVTAHRLQSPLSLHRKEKYRGKIY